MFLGPRARELDTSAWPYPAVRFLRGEIDQAQLLALAVDTGKGTEVHCFLGLHDEIESRKDAALAHFRWVKEHGTKSSAAYDIAVSEFAQA